ncbi:hypothetical protein DCN93_02770 [Campylobacter lari]|nr:hypothetical protein [Campylobacter lari]
MEGFDKELEQYGIFAKNGIKSIQENNITLINADIEKIDFDIMHEKNIDNLKIQLSEIKNIIFSSTNSIQLHFFSCKFKNQIKTRNIEFDNKIFFYQCTFEYIVDFSNTNFKDMINFHASRFKDEVRFIETRFLINPKINKTVNINFNEVDFENKVYFSKISFNINLTFMYSRFKNDIVFKDIIFFKNIINFYQIEFNNIKFIVVNNHKIKQTYFFKHSIFKGIINFQDLKIENLEFKDTVFNNIVVFDNTILDNKPKFTNCTFSNQFNIKHDYIQYDYNELKEKNKSTYDEFLNFRDLFRKLKSNRIAHHNLIDASELRAQELYARELELKHKENKNLKDTIEQWQLFFYRKLCDHHTDLILNAKWLIITIGMFASMLFMIKLYKCGLSILNIFNFYGLYLSALGSFILSALALFRCIDKMKAFVSINAIAILWVICYKPKLIFGIANLIGDNSYNAFENLLITIYTLIAGLIIFSLQKTARKNTIIPN